LWLVRSGCKFLAFSRCLNNDFFKLAACVKSFGEMVIHNLICTIEKRVRKQTLFVWIVQGDINLKIITVSSFFGVVQLEGKKIRPNQRVQ